MKTLPLICLCDFQNGDTARRSRVVQEIWKACTGIGFLYVSEHDVSPIVITRMRSAVLEIFSQPEKVKRKYGITRESYRGYIPFGFFTPASTDQQADQYEGFKLHLDVAPDDPICVQSSLYGQNLWPPNLVAARAAVQDYWAAVEQMTEQLLRVFALALGKAEGFFLPHFVQPLTGMTILHYPAMPLEAEGFGIHPHKDSSAFTVLYPDPVGGLQVQTHDGDWIDARPPEGAFIVNIGDVLEHWSGGVFKSTPHRVINKTGAERYSFPYFVTPRFDTIVEPVTDTVDNYNRPPLLMETWHQEIIDANWPDLKPINPNFDPQIR